ncbi:MAG: hypothetical protein A3E87_08720 [Gammaproteobacteria bacterium RIFCSPHIGHO2_12_FULL_35_23]|nr:MAG: hypothetical protein A3E87_08720 [Gammaproteobacteria bacterium RIFCSPHIGHO2_12_FULL_35_23]
MALLTTAIERKAPKSEYFLAWLVSLSGGLLFFYEFIQLNIINSISSQLMANFHINAGELGRLSSLYFYFNAGLLFVAGNLLDRFATRKLILMAMTFCTLGTFGFGLAKTVFFAGLCRALIGLGGSFCFLSGVRLASRWFPPRKMAVVTGLIVTMAFIGGWVAQTPATLLVTYFGWREMMMLNGCLGVVLIIWIWFVVQDRPTHHFEKATEEYLQLKQQGLWTSIKMVLSNKQNWLGGLYTCLLNLPIFLLGAMWGRMYLEQVDGFNAARASFICSMLFLGSIVGAPLMGFISDMLQQRRLPMLVSAILSLLVVLIIIYGQDLTFIQLSILFFILGLITCSQVISYPLVAEHNQGILTGTAVSIVSMICLLGGALGLPFSGWLLDLGWDHKVLNGAPVYSVQAYHQAMLIMPIAFVIGFVAAYFVKETYCRSQVHS